jgi:hypothetical protein
MYIRKYWDGQGVPNLGEILRGQKLRDMNKNAPGTHRRTWMG